MQRLEVSGVVRPLYGSLGVKGLTTQPHLAPRLKRVYSYNCTPPLGLHGLFYGAFCFFNKTL